MDKSTCFRNAFDGALIADALAMPVHWYYNTSALDQDYGAMDRFMKPKDAHPDSILWRSHYTAAGIKSDILHENKKYWGKMGVHYHRGLKAGENTLNFRLSQVLYDQIVNQLGYDKEAWARRYIAFMLNPKEQTDVYVEEYHRGYFENYERGKNPLKCGIKDIHIGGLAQIPALLAGLAAVAEKKEEQLEREALRQIVREHVTLTHRHSNLLRAADCLCRLLWALSDGVPLHDAIKREAGDWFSSRKAESWRHQLDRHVVGSRFSPACYIDQAFPASIYLAWKYDQSYKLGVQANAEVGGDNCHRGAVVGSLLACTDEGGLTEMLGRWKEHNDPINLSV